MERGICLLFGYLCGNLLTAELVARWRTGKGAGALGTGNPGMANIGGTLGAGWGLLVLAGDLIKTALASFVCRGLFPGLGLIAALYGGLGATLGHNFPLWKKFQGGKGVATTCAALVFASPVWGVASCLVGLGVVGITGYLPLGAVIIPAVFMPLAFWRYGLEAGAVAGVFTALMVSRHIRGLARIERGEEEKKFRSK